MKAHSKGADIILVAPVWILQPWYFLLVSMLVDWPCLLRKPDTITKSVPMVPCGASQGKSQQTRPFKSGCRPYPKIMEDEKKTSLMTHCLGDGIAGMLHGVQIHFQEL